MIDTVLTPLPVKTQRAALKGQRNIAVVRSAAAAGSQTAPKVDHLGVERGDVGFYHAKNEYEETRSQSQIDDQHEG